MPFDYKKEYKKLIKEYTARIDAEGIKGIIDTAEKEDSKEG